MPLPRRSTDDQVTATFLRGLTIGALVGAVIAGSSILTRRRGRRDAEPGVAKLSAHRPRVADGPGTEAQDTTQPDAASIGRLGAAERGAATEPTGSRSDGASSSQTR
jgi:hypothetical protein